MSTTLLEKILDQKAANTEEALARYAGLVRKFAAGEEPTLREVNEALAAAGKTPEELSGAVKKLIHKRDQAALVRRGDQAAEEIIRLRSQSEAAEAEFANGPLAAHRSKIWQLHCQIQDLAQETQNGAAARRWLQQEGRDAATDARLALLSSQIHGAHNETKAKLDVVERAKANLSSEKKSRRPGASEEWLAEQDGRGGDPSKVANLTARVERAESEYTAACDRLTALVNQQNEIMAGLLEA